MNSRIHSDIIAWFRKLAATEWVMFWLFGLFWAAAMYLPLFLAGSFDDKQLWPRNFVIMFGLYGCYLVTRVVYIVVTSLRAAYLVSSLFFRSEHERVLAREWFYFVVFGPLWGVIIYGPMFVAGFFTREFSWPLIAGIIAGPYAVYVFFRLSSSFLRLK